MYFLYDPKPNIDFLFILGILNSKTLNFYYRAKALTNKKSIAQVKKTDLDELPIALVDSDAMSPLVRLVEQVLALNLDLDRAKTSHEKKIVERRITAIESQIDHTVYDLYRLTKDEIALIESESP